VFRDCHCGKYGDCSLECDCQYIIVWYKGINVLSGSMFSSFLACIYPVIRIDSWPLSGPPLLLCFPLSCFMSSVHFITYYLFPREFPDVKMVAVVSSPTLTRHIPKGSSLRIMNHTLFCMSKNSISVLPVNSCL
jgi:hypothetical protein